MHGQQNIKKKYFFMSSIWYSSQILMKFHFSPQIFEKFLIPNFTKIRPVRA